MQLADVIDAEITLQGDRDHPDADARQRDERAAARIRERTENEPLHEVSNEQLISHWLELTLSRHPDSPGRRFMKALRHVNTFLVGIGLLAGAMATRVVLHYQGEDPVNVVHFLALLVGLQIATLIVLGARAWSLPHGFGPVLELLRNYLMSRSGGFPSSETASARVASYARLRATRSTLWHRLETWLLLLATQRFGVAFNVAAIGTTLYLVTFTDIAFSWATTLDWSPRSFHGLIQAVAAPWSWWQPDWVPSQETVKMTQYYRLEDRYVVSETARRAVSPDVVGEWWPFLVAALTTYGLLPRAAAWGICRWRVATLLRTWSSPATRALLTRLRRGKPTAGDGAPGEGAAENARHAAPGDGAPGTAGDGAAENAKHAAAVLQELAADRGVHVILWRDHPASEATVREQLPRNLGPRAQLVLRAGGSAGDFDAEQCAAAIRGSDLPRAPVVVFVEDWDAPAKAIDRFLRGLRSGLPEVSVVLFPVAEGQELKPPHARDVAAWRRFAATFADPEVATLTEESLP